MQQVRLKLSARHGEVVWQGPLGLNQQKGCVGVFFGIEW